MARKWMLTLCMIGLLFCFFLFLPTLCSTQWVNKQIVGHLQRQLGGNITVEKFTFSWGNKQSCHGIVWEDEQKKVSLNARQLDISANLLDCIRYKEKPLDLLIQGGVASCENNFRLISKKKRKNLQMHFSPISAKIQRGKIAFTKTEINVADAVQLLTWGEINLGENSMDLVFGLPSKTLKKLFKIKDLPEGYLMEIPVNGNLSSKSIENHLLSYFLKNSLLK